MNRFSAQHYSVVVAVIGVVGVISAALIQRPRGAGQATPSAPPAPQVTAVSPPVAPSPTRARSELSPDAILAAIDTVPTLRQNDAVKALYLGRIMQWTGIVDNVWEDRGALGVAMREPGACCASVYATFDRSWRNELSSLRKNDTITVSGTISQVWVRMRDIYLDSAIIVQ